MDQKLTERIKKINSKINYLGGGSFAVATMIALLKIQGCFDFAKNALLILQVIATFCLFCIIFITLPKYHDENKDKVNGKGRYGKSVFLFSKIDLVKLHERVITVVIADIFLFISEKEIFIDPWKTVLFWLIFADLVFWSIFKFMKLNKQKFVFVKYFFICILLVLMLCSLSAPVFLIINTIKTVKIIGAVALVAIILIFYLFQRNPKNSN